MRILLAIILGVGLSIISLSEVRKLYIEAPEDEEIANTLYDKLQDIKEDEKPVLKAYKGASIFLKAKNTKGINKKIKYLKEGKKWVENAVSEDSENVEIRCVRLSLQENLPKVVGYSSSKKTDRDFITANYQNITDDSTQAYVKNFVMHSGLFSKEEQAFVKE